VALDPSEHTVDELRDELEDVDDPEELEGVLDAEREAEDRKTAKEAVERRLDDLGEDEAEERETQSAAGQSEDESGAAGEGATAERTESGAAGEEAGAGAQADPEVGGASGTGDAEEESVASGDERLRRRALEDSRRARDRLDERLRNNR
jgi:hypothetical protein